MAALYVMVPVALILVALAIRFFFWAVDSGQYDDLDGPAHSILFDDPLSHVKKVQQEETQELQEQQQKQEQQAAKQPASDDQDDD